MTCDTVRMLIPFLRPLSELGADDRSEIQAHLQTCSDCRGIAEREQAFDESVQRAFSQVELPTDLQSRIATKLAERNALDLRRLTLRWTTAAVAVLVLFSFGLGWWRSSDAVSADQFVADEDAVLVHIFGGNATAVTEYYRQHGLKVTVPGDLDYSLLSGLDVVDWKGKPIARMNLQRGTARAKVYVLPKKHFKLGRGSAAEWAGSNCRVEITDESPNFLFVFVFFDDAIRAMFQPRGVVG